MLMDRMPYVLYSQSNIKTHSATLVYYVACIQLHLSTRLLARLHLWIATWGVSSPLEQISEYCLSNYPHSYFMFIDKKIRVFARHGETMAKMKFAIAVRNPTLFRHSTDDARGNFFHRV